MHVGYRGFDARAQEVAYPFGFGLSYTTFEYGQPGATVTDAGIELRIPVTNTGGRDGREVVQVYVSLPGSAVRRAPRELKAFANVAIAAGQTADVTLSIARGDLAYWETRLGRWGGEYHCAVGASSRDLRVTAVAEVPGDDARVPLTAESTVAEWFADSRGAELLSQALAAPVDGDSGLVSGVLADPGLMEFLGSLPLSRMTTFPGSPVTAEVVEKLAAAAND
jgi:beta-glucosidase